MKRILIISISILALVSCRKADELPPLTDGYASTVIVPDPENLTSEDREYLEELEKEYQSATK